MADIEEKVNLRIYPIRNFGFQLNLEQGLLKVENEILILNHRGDIVVRATFS